MLAKLIDVKADVTEMRTVGNAYLNAANFAARLARDQVLFAKSQERHNEQLKNGKKIVSVEAKIAELERKLQLLRAKKG